MSVEDNWQLIFFCTCQQINLSLEATILGPRKNPTKALIKLVDYHRKRIKSAKYYSNKVSHMKFLVSNDIWLPFIWS
jgi:hypothetical protein